MDPNDCNYKEYWGKEFVQQLNREKDELKKENAKLKQDFDDLKNCMSLLLRFVEVKA